jgi:hypothetical protein
MLILVLTGCKMWPASVGIYNKSAESIDIELYVNNVTGAAEIFPLLVNKFDEDYLNSGSRNVSPLRIDTVDLNIKTRYSLAPGECLNIGNTGMINTAATFITSLQRAHQKLIR